MTAIFSVAMEASITFKGDAIPSINLSFIEGKLIVSKRLLQMRLGNNHSFHSISAVVTAIDDVRTSIPLQSYTDIEGGDHFLLDESMSVHYEVNFNANSSSMHGTINLDSSDTSEDKIGKRQYRECQSTDSPRSPEFCKHNTATINLDSPEDRPSNVGKWTPLDEETVRPEKTKPEKSAIEMILSRPGSSTLTKLLQRIQNHCIVSEIPRIYDGDIVFELPPTQETNNGMRGMEQRYDGHLWTKPVTSNIVFDGVVRMSYCVGLLECQRVTCPYFLNGAKKNTTFFRGTMKKKCPIGLLADGAGTIVCAFCKKVVVCVGSCPCTVYYVMPREVHYSRLMVHIGKHAHYVQPGTNRASIQRTRSLVDKVVALDKAAGPRKVQMSIAKELIMATMLKEDRAQNDTVGDLELSNFLEEIVPLVENRR